MRYVSVVALLVVMHPGVAHAFNGREHRDLSNLALQTALTSGKGSDDMQRRAQTLLTGSKNEGTFGELVSAVDAFSHPEERLTAGDAWDAIRKRSNQRVFHLL